MITTLPSVLSKLQGITTSTSFRETGHLNPPLLFPDLSPQVRYQIVSQSQVLRVLVCRRVPADLDTVIIVPVGIPTTNIQSEDAAHMVVGSTGSVARWQGNAMACIIGSASPAQIIQEQAHFEERINPVSA